MFGIFGKSARGATSPASVAPVAEPPFAQVGLWICEKCGKKLGAEPNPSILLRDEIKKALRDQLPRGQARVMVTSCLDICPEGKIALALVPTDGSGPAMFMEADASITPKALTELVVDAAQHKR